MWKVSRMKPARIIVLVIALAAGGIAALLAGRSDPPPQVQQAPVAPLETVDVLVAASDIGLGNTVSGNEVRWQTWPAAAAGSNFIRRNNRPDAVNQIAGSIARSPFFAGEPIREAETDPRQGLGLHGSDPAVGHARGFDRRHAGDRRRRLHPAERSCRRHPLAPRPRSREGNRRRGPYQRDDPDQRARARDRPDGRGERRPARRRRQDCDARALAAAGGNARDVAPDGHAVARLAQLWSTPKASRNGA